MKGFQINYLGLIFKLLGLLIVNVIRVLESIPRFFGEFFASFRDFRLHLVDCAGLGLLLSPAAIIIWDLAALSGFLIPLISFFLSYVSFIILYCIILSSDENIPTLATRLYFQIPIIGHLLQIEAVLKLLKDGSPQSLKLLVKSFSNYQNYQTLAFVLNWLGHIEKQSSINAICKIWANTRNKDLEKLLFKEKWVASTPANIKVLSALKTKQLKFITNGGEEIIEPLLNALKDRDSDIANQASKCAIILDKPEYQESLYRLVTEQNHPIARQVVVNGQYLPKDSIQKALFYFMTEQWDKYERLDFDQTLLKKAYELANELLRKRITEKLKQRGRVEWLKIISSGSHEKGLEAMTNAEWKTTLTVLNSNKQWESMWQLSQKAPVVWSKQLLHKLKQQAWLPEAEQEQLGFEKLIEFAQNCLNEKPPLTGGLMRSQVICPEHIGSARVAFSPDNQFLVSWSEKDDNTIKIWQMPNGQLLSTLSTPKHTGTRYVTFSSDGQFLASWY